MLKKIQPRSRSVSVAGIARDAKRAESALTGELETLKDQPGIDAKLIADAKSTADSFVNFAQKLGVGADNPLSTASYGFNPVTRIRTVLEWVHRGSWLGGMAIDVIADDMTRAGISFQGDVDPGDAEKIQEAMVTLGVWNALNDNIKWSRLYGGSIAVLLIDGQAMDTPLRIETVGKGMFKGLLVLDRWMCDPSLNNLVKELGPDLGMPKFYTVNETGPALRQMKIHYTRVIRMEGVRLPYWQRVMENLWGISVLERLWDRMIAFDSATTGAAQLIYKAYIRTYRIKGLREIVAAGGKPLEGLVKSMEFMRRYQGLEGITLMDLNDEFEGKEQGTFAGLDDALTQFGQQISGALQIPLVRLFGQSPSGFNSGDTDLKMYYDTIENRQEKEMRVGVTKIARCTAQSEGVKLKDGFRIEFNHLWQMSEKEKAETAEVIGRTVGIAVEQGLASQKVGMQELKESSQITGVFSNISDKDINSADEEAAPAAELALGEAGALDPVTGEPKPEGGAKPGKSAPATAEKPAKAAKAAKDTAGINAVTAMKRLHNFDIVIEHSTSEHRTGHDWEAVLAAPYGYFAGTKGADGECIDCFVGSQFDSGKVFVIDQRNPQGLFDEHKVLLGYGDAGPALADYFGSYNDGMNWGRVAGVHNISMDEFKQWLNNGDHSRPYQRVIAQE